MNLDLYFFNLINRYTKKQAWLYYAGIFFAKYLIYLMLAVLLLFAVIKKDIFLFLYPILSGLFARFLINEPIYFFYKRKRPCEVLNIESLIKKPKHPSFPSGHASFLFGISFMLFYYNFVLAIVFIVLSGLVVSARVFCRVHWFSDILAGVVAGGFSAVVINYLVKLWI